MYCAADHPPALAAALRAADRRRMPPQQSRPGRGPATPPGPAREKQAPRSLDRAGGAPRLDGRPAGRGPTCGSSRTCDGPAAPRTGELLAETTRLHGDEAHRPLDGAAQPAPIREPPGRLPDRAEIGPGGGRLSSRAGIGATRSCDSGPAPRHRPG
ncbi:hypothetical protein AVW11_26260 [Streptomyces amritsarensis]|uniref:Uncharacterized protein n=1 Tax=Streptomyces amritsarensis TaxID=681158 RepID=A0ABX3FW76_9ACTN|nr:hypothetical protein AVW11_26260 [Streptomyces amritsarensis]